MAEITDATDAANFSWSETVVTDVGDAFEGQRLVQLKRSLKMKYVLLWSAIHISATTIDPWAK